MDWNKASGLSGVGTFVLTLVVVGLMVWPLLPGRPAPQAVVQMMGWGPIILLAVCLVLAGWLHLKAAQISQSAGPALPRTTEKSVGAMRDQEPPVLVKDTIEQPEDRVFLNKTLLELVAPFESGLTAYRAEKLVADYLNKWVRWELPIIDVGLSGDTPRIMSLVRSDVGMYLSARMYFLSSERTKVMHLEKGAIIEVEGKIQEISQMGVWMIDCILVAVKPSSVVEL